MSAMLSAPAPIAAQRSPSQTSVPVKPATQSVTGKLIIVKLHHNQYALDLYADRLTAQGYDVITTSTYADALDAAHRYHPALIIVHDDPEAQVDAVRWLEIQHTDRVPALAMTPLIMLADSARVPFLRTQELPDRVIVLRNRADTLNQLTHTVQRVLRVWGLNLERA
ncbi:MAG: PleD family two-component system response regulator [Aggregatilineales bacterium]